MQELLLIALEILSKTIIISSYIILQKNISCSVIFPHLRLWLELCLSHLRNLVYLEEAGPRNCGRFIRVKGLDLLSHNVFIFVI